ncbi:hypothetical protein JW948_01930 [bacterium]|nr:hypothetical protein [bacterium]
MIKKIRNNLWNIISCGLPMNYCIDVLRIICMLNIIIILGGFFLILLGAVAYIQHQYTLGTVDIIMLFFLMWLFSFLKKSRNYHRVSFIGTGTILVFYGFLIVLGGASNTAYIWSFTYPLIALFLLGAGLGTMMSLILLGLAIAVFVSGPHVAFIASYHTDLIIRFIPSYITVLLFALVMERSRNIVQERLTMSKGHLEESNAEKERLIHELKDKIDELKVLRGIVPICASCKRVRNDSGF